MTCVTLSEDVHNVLKEYIAAIGAKDADIFNLYDSNLHLRGLLDEAVRRTHVIEEELKESQEQNMRRLQEDTLRHEEEKKKMEQERQKYVHLFHGLQSQFTELSMNDVESALMCLEELARDHKRLVSIVEKYESGREQQITQFLNYLICFEENNRQTIQELYKNMMNSFMICYQELFTFAGGSLELMELEKITHLEQSTHIIEQLEFDNERRKNALKLTRRKLEIADNKIATLEAKLYEAHKNANSLALFYDLYTSKAEGIISLLVSRILEVEQGWVEAITESKRIHIKERVQFNEEMANHESKHREAMTLLHEKTTEYNNIINALRTSVATKNERIEKYKVSVEELKRAKGQTSTLLQRQRVLATKREAMLRKNNAMLRTEINNAKEHSEKERDMFVQQVNEQKKKLASCQVENENLEIMKKELECELHKRENAIAELQRCLEEAHNTQAHMNNVQQLLSELKMEYEAKVNQLRCEYDAKQKQNAKEFEHIENKHKFALRAKEVENDALQKTWEEKYNSLQENANNEVREWAEIAQKWKTDACDLQEELNKERDIRELLESQQCSESQLLRHLLRSPSSTREAVK